MIKTNEQGIVSIMVTAIMMIVISITVLSFAQVIRREQRQALDNQLSSQAFYAAETGINDARSIINGIINDPSSPPLPSKDNCSGDLGGESLDYIINDSSSYTCLLVNPAPEDLEYKLDIDSSSIITKLSPVGNLNKITLAWKPQDIQQENGPSSVTDGCSVNLPNSTTPFFEPNDSWPCAGYGMLRIDLVPVSGGFSRAGLMSSTYTAFVVPTLNDGVSGTNYTPSAGAAAAVVPAKCSTSNCTFSIKSISSGDYYMRILPLYRNSDELKISGNGPGGAVKFAGAQVVIDSTGKAEDVLRRLQVRVPLTGGGEHADYAVETTWSICKTFRAYYNSSDPESSSFKNTTSGGCSLGSSED